MNDHIDDRITEEPGQGAAKPRYLGRQRRAARTESQILTAAAELFDTVGYAATSVNTIMTGAELTKGAIYFHFPSKEAIAQRLIEGWSTAVKDAFAAAAVTDGSEVEQLRVVLGDLAALVDDDQSLRAGFKLTLDPGVDGAHAAFRQWIDTTADLVEAAIAAGMIRDSPAGHRLAWNLCAGFTGAVLHEDVALADRVEDMTRALLAAAR